MLVYYRDVHMKLNMVYFNLYLLGIFKFKAKLLSWKSSVITLNSVQNSRGMLYLYSADQVWFIIQSHVNNDSITGYDNRVA